MDADQPVPEAPEKASPLGLKLLLPVIVILVIVGGVTLLLAGGPSKPVLPGNAGTVKISSFQGQTLEPPQPAPALALDDYTGESFNLVADRGKAVYVTFLYAHCPDVCPLIASNLHNAYAKMTPAERAKVDIVAVSVDPRGDTAGTVGAFMRQHQLAGEGKYLIGRAGQLVPVWKAWQVGSERDVNKPEQVGHSALIYGVSGSGKLYTIYPANFAPEQIINDIAPLAGH